MISKLKSKKGETITEVLVASLVTALALVLLVSMMTAAQRMVKKSGDVFSGNMQVKNSAEYGGPDSSDPANTASPEEEDGYVTVRGGKILDAGAKNESESSFAWGGSDGNADRVAKIPVKKQSYANGKTRKKTLAGYLDP